MAHCCTCSKSAATTLLTVVAIIQPAHRSTSSMQCKGGVFRNAFAATCQVSFGETPYPASCWTAETEVPRRSFEMKHFVLAVMVGLGAPALVSDPFRRF